MKTGSVFFNTRLKNILQNNIKEYTWAEDAKKLILKNAEPWLSYSDNELWEMMFGSTIHRAWMVWSDGYCPSCGKDVRMYSWKIDALNIPWKVACPHCKELFPKNDFYSFYKSGLNKSGVFNRDLADNNLLFNTEHPDPKDPLHKFGVDDGEGYIENNKRWRFIGAYLIYGQWKQLIVTGVKNLSAAYAVSNDPKYARKAAILLDRIADLYPDFDYAKQGSAYETSHGSGYVSTWHDACEETRELAMAYDLIFDALPKDSELVSFLSDKSKQFDMNNSKACFADIQKNIEKGILEDPLIHTERIHNNYPRTEAAIIILKTILDRKEFEKEINDMLDDIIEKATSVDGVTGEKGMAGYAAYTIHGLALLLAQFDRINPNFLVEIKNKHENLTQTYRFHIDTYCLNRYYPRIGDTGSFARPDDKYAGVQLQPQITLNPSMFMFLYRLYQITNDVAYIQTIYRENGSVIEGLPYDLMCSDTQKIQNEVKSIIEKHSSSPVLMSMDKQNWHLALLRSGKAENERILWIDYDSGGKHSHSDGLNIGYFAKGLDILPDFGYPPVQYGGWRSPKANWYKMSAAHNTVVVDGKNQKSGIEPIGGKTILWGIGKNVKAIGIDGTAITDCKRYERTLLLIDHSDKDSYIVDLFRVAGGSQHVKFTGSSFGSIKTKGLKLQTASDYSNMTQMRNCTEDTPNPGWFVDWKLEDKYNLFDSEDKELHLRYIDLTEDAKAQLSEAWVAVSEHFANTTENWIPRVSVKRENNKSELVSDFISVLEPYEKSPFICNTTKVSAYKPNGKKFGKGPVVINVQQIGAKEDLIVLNDIKQKRYLKVPSWDLEANCSCCVLRRSKKGLETIFATDCRYLNVDGLKLCYKKPVSMVELEKTHGIWNIRKK